MTRFDRPQRPYYCGVDRPAITMHLGVVDDEGLTGGHVELHCNPRRFLHTVAEAARSRRPYSRTMFGGSPGLYFQWGRQPTCRRRPCPSEYQNRLFVALLPVSCRVQNILHIIILRST